MMTRRISARPPVCQGRVQDAAAPYAIPVGWLP